MANSPLQSLRDGPPPPKVALLPDGLFFVRAVGIDASNAPGSALTAAEVASQVELALEAIAPFPLAQVYYGHFWLPGAGRWTSYWPDVRFFFDPPVLPAVARPVRSDAGT